MQQKKNETPSRQRQFNMTLASYPNPALASSDSGSEQDDDGDDEESEDFFGGGGGGTGSGSGGRKASKGRARVGKGSCDAAVNSTGSGKVCGKDAADSAEARAGGQGIDRACGDEDVHDVGEASSPSTAAAAPGLGMEVRFFFNVSKTPGSNPETFGVT